MRKMATIILVLIPLKSGLGWNYTRHGDYHGTDCLNPFEIRAGLEPESIRNYKSSVLVLIPLKSGLGWNQYWERLDRYDLVLIPLKSGLGWFLGEDASGCVDVS